MPPSHPLVCESVPSYIASVSSSPLIDWLVNYFTSTHDGSDLEAIVYQMFDPPRRFGQVILSSLQVFENLFSFSSFSTRFQAQSRNVCLLGAVPYPTIDSLDPGSCFLSTEIERGKYVRNIATLSSGGEFFAT